MTSSDSILTLISRLEQATEGSRELDELIQKLMRPEQHVHYVEVERELRRKVAEQGMLKERGEACHRSAFFPTPRYTECIDDALTLVSEDAPSWDCGRIDKDFSASVGFPVGVNGFNNYHARSKANAAIALCISALMSLSHTP